MRKPPTNAERALTYQQDVEAVVTGLTVLDPEYRPAACRLLLRLGSADCRSHGPRHAQICLELLLSYGIMRAGRIFDHDRRAIALRFIPTARAVPWSSNAPGAQRDQVSA